MSTTSVRKASIKITAPGGAVSAEGVNFIMAVNSAPTVEVILRRAKEDVVRPMSEDVIAAMKAAQAARLSLRSGTPDTTIEAFDGDEGRLTFKGFSVAPVLEHSKVSSGETVNVVGVDAFLNGLGLSIYSSRPQNPRPEAIDQLFKETPNKATGNISQLIWEVTRVLGLNAELTLSKITTASMKEVFQKKHAANKEALKVWDAILKNSDVNYPEWQATFSKLPMLGRAAAERVKEMLQQRTSSFWDVVNGLGAEFLFFYRPAVDGSSGKLVRVDKKLEDSGKSLKAGVVRFSGTDGNPSMLPLGGTIIYGPSLPQLRKETTPYAISTVVGQWPVDIKPGYFQELGAPAWITSGAGKSFQSFLTKPSSGGAAAAATDGKKNLDPMDYKKRREGMGSELQAAENVLTTLLQHYARVSFEDMQLADSTATLEIPLNFGVEVGHRYRFTTGEGGGGFTAFIRALRHSLTLQGGQTLLSGTTLTLTHIKYD